MIRQRDEDKGTGGASLHHDLASLPLPAPAVVIDVRRNSRYDPSLIQHLATELDDLTTEMHLHQAYRWRYLAECMKFLKLNPLPSDKTLDTATHFTLETSAGNTETFKDKEELAKYVNGEYVNQVRNNRISAATDRGKSSLQPSVRPVGPEKSTVRLFFLTDMADTDSVISAASYANLLKQWNYDYDDPARTGRDERLTTIAICMNADPSYHRHTAPQQKRAAAISTACDIIILIHPYRDDDAFVGGDMQSYEVELILYTLLLVSPENLVAFSEDFVDDQDVSKYLTTIEQHEVPLPSGATYMIGISALEYSARLGARWLDYGLVRKILETIRDPQEVNEEGEPLQLPSGQDWLSHWWSRVKAIVPDSLTTVMPDLQALYDFEKLLASSPFAASSLRSSHLTMENFCQQISQYYTGTGRITLQCALESASQVPGLLKKAARDEKEKENTVRSPFDEQLIAVVELQTQAELLPISLFRGAKGALPRALHQISELTTKLEHGEIGQIKRNLPDLAKRRESFENEAEQTQQYLANLLKMWRLPVIGRVLRSTVISLSLIILTGIIVWSWPFELASLPPIVAEILTTRLLFYIVGIRLLLTLGIILGELLYLFIRNKHLRRQRNAVANKLRQVAYAHLGEVRSAIAAKVALLLLQEAGLYHPEGRPDQYTQRLRVLDKLLEAAQDRASFQQRGAYEHLKPSLSQVQVGRSRASTWLSLSSRKDLLLWDETVESFQRLSEELTTHNVFLDLLVEILLRRLGAEQPAVTTKSARSTQYRSTQDSVQEQLQIIGTELVAVLLSSEVVGPSVKTLHPLVDQYMLLRGSTVQEPSVLEDNIIELQQAVKEIMLEQAMRSSADSKIQNEVPDSFAVRPSKPIEQLLAAWVQNQRSGDEQTMEALNYSDIMTRLKRFQIKPAEALEDLRERCRLLGYRNEAIDNDHFYLLLVPGNASDEFLEAFDPMKATQIRPVHFPDEEKLIYLHVHRMRSAVYEAFSLMRM